MNIDDTDDTGAPNLDAMPRSELLEWAAVRKRGRGHARALFPSQPRLYISATRILVLYADNKAAAMYCREHGDISGALMYEGFCERLYNRLPTFARW